MHAHAGIIMSTELQNWTSNKKKQLIHYRACLCSLYQKSTTYTQIYWNSSHSKFDCSCRICIHLFHLYFLNSTFLYNCAYDLFGQWKLQRYNPCSFVLHYKVNNIMILYCNTINFMYTVEYRAACKKSPVIIY